MKEHSADSSETRAPDFLGGGGEMGALMRAHCWSDSLLGAPLHWPQSLRTVVRIMLNTGHPMYIFWGPDRACLYNDAYRESIGPERHPGSLGQPAVAVWSEIWDIIGPQIEQVMSGGGATWHVNHLVPITRHGVLEQVYWTYSYSPIDDETAAHGIGGVLVVCTETTEQIDAARQLAAERDQLNQLFEQAPTFMALLRGADHRFELANPGYMQLVGYRPLLGQTVAEALPDAVAQGYLELLDQVYASGQPYAANGAKYAMQLLHGGPVVERFVDFVFQPIKDSDGKVTGIFVEGADVTDRARADAALRESDARFRLLDSIGEATRTATDPRAIMQVTTRLLGEHLNAMRCAYADVESDQDWFTIRDDWTASGYAAILGGYSLSAFGVRAVAELRRGIPLVIHDVDNELTPSDGGDTFNALQIKAVVCCPLIKADGLRGLMAVHAAAARHWSASDVSLIQAVVERSWAHIERVRAEALLRANEARLTDLIDTMPSLIWTADSEGEVLWVSRWLQAFTGRPADRFFRRYWPEFIHGEDLVRLLESWAQSVASSAPFRIICRTLRADGAWRWLMILADPVLGEDGRVESWCGSGADVHDFKNASDALQQIEPRLRGLLETIPGFIWTADASGEIDYISPRFLAFVGREETRFKRAFWPEFIHSEDMPKVIEVWTRVNELRISYEIDVRFLRHDGVWRWLVLRAEPELDADGNLVSWYGYGVDQHEQKQIADELIASEARFREMAAQLSDANRLKDEFLATLAHELRNPLAPICNAVELLKLAPMDGLVAVSAREMIERQVGQMVRMIDDLLDLARVSRGIVELRRSRIRLAHALRDAVETSAPLIEQSGHAIVVNIQDEDLVVEADSTRIVQVFANLLNNAAKFTPRGGVIQISLEREAGESDSVVVSVRDNGIGIPNAMLNTVFDMFTQVGRTHAHVGGGLGIGLTLVRRLVEMHGGTVEARSDGLDMGSQFLVRLPLAPALHAVQGESEPSLADYKSSTGTRRVLVADDNVDAAESLSLMLNLLGYETRTAHDGNTALAVAREFRPHVLVLDIAMPGLGGHDIARSVRVESWGSNVLMIAASGWGQAKDKQRSYDAGFDHHLVKPVEFEALHKLLRA